MSKGEIGKLWNIADELSPGQPMLSFFLVPGAPRVYVLHYLSKHNPWSDVLSIEDNCILRFPNVPGDQQYYIQVHRWREGGQRGSQSAMDACSLLRRSPHSCSSWSDREDVLKGINLSFQQQSKTTGPFDSKATGAYVGQIVKKKLSPLYQYICSDISINQFDRQKY